jgi:TPR repeat protein
MKMKIALGLLFVLPLIISQAGMAQQGSVSADELAAECNRLSAHPEDHLSGVKGVNWDDLDVEAARTACVAVFSAGQATGQTWYQSARLLDKDGDSQAVGFLRTAITDFDYPMAYYHLGVLYEEGLYVQKNVEKAEELYHKGFERGSIVSGVRWSKLLKDSKALSMFAYPKYLKSLEELASKGHAPSAEALAVERSSEKFKKMEEFHRKMDEGVNEAMGLED